MLKFREISKKKGQAPACRLPFQIFTHFSRSTFHDLYSLSGFPSHEPIPSPALALRLTRHPHTTPAAGLNIAHITNRVSICIQLLRVAH